MEAAFQRPQQREMVVEDIALQLVETVIGVYDGRHLVDDRLNGIVILIPDYDDGVPASPPRRRGVNGIYDLLHRLVSQRDQRRIQPILGSIVVWIVLAECRAIAAPVLIVALVRHDVRQRRRGSPRKIPPQSTRALKA